ncbi:MAG TPA: type II toxin-antitoxin system prevent-host-death family antitoxin [Actinomycetota bacterium]|nr:type II toxin-antitoxin system prevent-host-death family antitoxin [Actinomycetota bacterium]
MEESVGLREMRQEASELVRRVQAGEEIVVTISGRPAARLVPVGRSRWRKGREISYLFDEPTDPQWRAERSGRSGELDDAPQDPWSATP